MVKSVYGHMSTRLEYGSTWAELDPADILQKYPSTEFCISHTNTSHRRADIAFSYDILILFTHFFKNATRNFKHQRCLSINYQLKMHTSLSKGRSNSPTATTDKEGEWLRTGDMTRLHSLRLRQDWKLIGCYQVQGQECHTIHLNESKCFCTETACMITSCSCCVCWTSCFSEDY